MSRTKENTPMPNGYILCLDVAFANLGWSVFCGDRLIDCGVISTSKEKGIKVAHNYSQRSKEIAVSLQSVLNKYPCKIIAGELPHGGTQSATSAAAMAMSNAVVSVVAALNRIPTKWVAPYEVKVALSGDKNASKEDQMFACVKRFKGRTKAKAPNKKGSVVRKWKLCDKEYTSGSFEHIADSTGVFLVVYKDSYVRRCLCS